MSPRNIYIGGRSVCRIERDRKTERETETNRYVDDGPDNVDVFDGQGQILAHVSM